MRNPIVAIVLLIAVTSPASAQTPSDRAALAARTKAEFLHAWEGYQKYAKGYDELLPLSKTGKNWHDGHTLLMTPVDALDTMLIMGLQKEADETRAEIV